jgi:hypothetical protein
MIQSRSRSALLFTLLAACFCWPAAAYSITLPQVDNFQDGTTRNWTNGGAPTISNVADGGPNGAGDSFLQVTSTGVGTGGSRLITFNTTQWIGDYNMAGVGAISMDLKFISLGDPTTDIRPIRLAIFNPLTDTGYASTDSVPGGAFVLPNDGAWHHWTFTLSTDSMSAIGTPPAFSMQLSNVTELRILGSAVPATSGDRVVAQLGIDNITAVPAPLLQGDFNHDGRFDVADIQAAMNALADLSGYQAFWRLNNSQMLTLGDFNNDMSVNNLDVQGLINALANGAGSGTLSAVPEPATLFQLVLGGATLLALSRRRD